MSDPPIQTGYLVLADLTGLTHFVAAAEMTQLNWRSALESLFPGPLRKPACRFMARRFARIPDRFAALDGLIAAETGAVGRPAARGVRE